MEKIKIIPILCSMILGTSSLAQSTIDVTVSQERVKNEYEYKFKVVNNDLSFTIKTLIIGCEPYSSRGLDPDRIYPFELHKEKDETGQYTDVAKFQGRTPQNWKAILDYSDGDHKLGIWFVGGSISPGVALDNFVVKSKIELPEIFDIPICLKGSGDVSRKYTVARPGFVSPPNDDKNLDTLIKECIDSNYKLEGLSIKYKNDKSCKKLRGDDKEILIKLTKTCERLSIQKLRLDEILKFEADPSNYSGDLKLAKYLSEKGKGEGKSKSKSKDKGKVKSKGKNKADKLIEHTQKKIAKEEKHLGKILKKQDEYIKKSEGCEFK